MHLLETKPSAVVEFRCAFGLDRTTLLLPGLSCEDDHSDPGSEFPRPRRNALASNVHMIVQHSLPECPTVHELPGSHEWRQAWHVIVRVVDAVD